MQVVVVVIDTNIYYKLNGAKIHLVEPLEVFLQPNWRHQVNDDRRISGRLKAHEERMKGRSESEVNIASIEDEEPAYSAIQANNSHMGSVIAIQAQFNSHIYGLSLKGITCLLKFCQ